ncbi:flagellar brake protein [Aquibacillus sediminis]|uniref:flagellar brake protein n=1 Tax=Aquibacillus sediminis TaxID=2574734 RepID=UPI0011094B9C|nr:flagellar brake domain-containing protein [Aquibacillus sediminis]
MIKVGTTLNLESINNNEDVERYHCKVVETEQDVIFVDYPINDQTGRTSIFPKETVFSASFVGEDSSVYRFDTSIYEKRTINNIPVLMLAFPSEKLERIQRREYVRIQASVDIAIHSVHHEFEPFTTVTQDISGGGASIFTPKHLQLQPGTIVDVWLVIPNENGKNNYIHTVSEVIRVKDNENHSSGSLSLAFSEINEKERQHIIRFCFEKQRKSRGAYLR